MRLAIGADEAGAQLAGIIAARLREQRFEIEEFATGTCESYADVAIGVARKVADGTYQRAILICGTGIGMSIAANKVPGVYAALCHDTYSAERARLSNNAQVLTMGARVVGVELALTVVEAWLHADFVEGPSSPKLQRLAELEQELLVGRPGAG